MRLLENLEKYKKREKKEKKKKTKKTKNKGEWGGEEGFHDLLKSKPKQGKLEMPELNSKQIQYSIIGCLGKI